ncbi:MAG TPA: TetR/AcrR family transcriptional regulator [Gammaproteobacteria bacterium]
MAEQGQQSRERIVEAANRLFYIKGYNQTSFAAVADEVGISKGNLHYHFRSKDDLLDAIISFRINFIKQNLANWDEEYPDGKARLKRFVQMLLNEEADLVRYGCPLGSLNMELGKDQRDLQKRSREMFDLFQQWLEKAFKQMGRKDSKSLSTHLLTMAQGAALMTYVYSDRDLLKAECKNMFEWIETL